MSHSGERFSVLFYSLNAIHSSIKHRPKNFFLDNLLRHFPIPSQIPWPPLSNRLQIEELNLTDYKRACESVSDWLFPSDAETSRDVNSSGIRMVDRHNSMHTKEINKIIEFFELALKTLSEFLRKSCWEFGETYDSVFNTDGYSTKQLIQIVKHGREVVDNTAKAHVFKNEATEKEQILEHKLYNQLDTICDYYLLKVNCMCALLTCFQLKMMDAEFKSMLTEFQDVGMQFITNGLKRFEKFLEAEEPNFLKANINVKTAREMSKLVTFKTPHTKHCFRHVINKIKILNLLFRGADFYVFPSNYHLHKSTIKSIDFSSLDNNIVITGSYDTQLKIIETEEFKLLGIFGGHKSIVTSALFARGDQMLVSGSFDHTVRIWNSRTTQCIQVLEGHADGVTGVSLSPDHKYIASSSLDKTVRVWSIDSARCVGVFKGCSSWVKCVQILPDTHQLSVGCGELSGMVHTFRVVPSLQNNNNTTAAKSNAGKDDNSNDVEEEKASDKVEILSRAKIHGDSVLGIDLHATVNGSRYLMATTSRDGCTIITDYKFGATKIVCEQYQPNWSSCVSFSADGKFIVTGSFDNYVLIYDSEEGGLFRTFMLNEQGISVVRFHPQLPRLIVGTDDGYIITIDL
eukprot:Nk52_evm124s221 gene=Nk52_evmTU124s221